MNDNTILIIGAIALGGWYLMQEQKKAAELQAAQLAALQRSRSKSSEGTFEKIGGVVDSATDLIKGFF